MEWNAAKFDSIYPLGNTCIEFIRLCLSKLNYDIAVTANLDTTYQIDMLSIIPRNLKIWIDISGLTHW
jgi:hypothetical protein